MWKARYLLVLLPVALFYLLDSSSATLLCALSAIASVVWAAAASRSWRVCGVLMLASCVVHFVGFLLVLKAVRGTDYAMGIFVLPMIGGLHLSFTALAFAGAKATAWALSRRTTHRAKSAQ